MVSSIATRPPQIGSNGQMAQSQTLIPRAGGERTRLRVLLIAEAANPEWVSVPLVGWSHAAALLDIVDGHLVTQIRNEEAIRRSGLDAALWTAIDSERVAAPLYRIAERLRGGSEGGWTTDTAIAALSYYYFERLVWERFGADIRAHRYDLVHRITPLSPTAPSLIAGRCHRAGVPFVWGPINGGLPWPKSFDAERRREREWLSYVRGLYRLLPGQGRTRAHAAAIIAGSLATLAEVPKRHRAKCIFVPENGIEAARFTKRRKGAATLPLRVAFVGRLVPYKCPDVLLEAAAPLVREGKVFLDIIGDGPEMGRLRELAMRLGITGGVRLDGWVEHRMLQDRLVQSAVLALPSIREFGGGVAVEAMALGLLPIVVDYGGPGELVTDETGIRVPMGPREQLVASFRSSLEDLIAYPDKIDNLAARARVRAFEHFTWSAKAQQTHEVYRWVTGQRPDRPDFGLVDDGRLRAAYEAR